MDCWVAYWYRKTVVAEPLKKVLEMKLASRASDSRTTGLVVVTGAAVGAAVGAVVGIAESGQLPQSTGQINRTDGRRMVLEHNRFERPAQAGSSRQMVLVDVDVLVVVEVEEVVVVDVLVLDVLVLVVVVVVTAYTWLFTIFANAKRTPGAVWALSVPPLFSTGAV